MSTWEVYVDMEFSVDTKTTLRKFYVGVRAQRLDHWLFPDFQVLGSLKLRECNEGFSMSGILGGLRAEFPGEFEEETFAC